MPYILPQYDFNGKKMFPDNGQQNIQPASANDALMNYADYYKKYTGYGYNPDSILAKIDNFFTGKEGAARQAYENYLSESEFRRNQAATSAQNQLTFDREDSQIQRLMQDYKVAGLNPYILLSGGNLSSGVVSSQASGPTYKRSSYKKEKKSGSSSSAVSSAIRAIALIAMLAR